MYLYFPMIDVAKIDSKISYYGVGTLMGKNKDQMNKYIERVDNAIEGIIDKFMNKLEENKFNFAFIGYFVSALSHEINHNCYNHLSKEGLERIEGINNEAARRYKNNLNNDNQNQNNVNIDDKLKNINKNNIDNKDRNNEINKVIKDYKKINQKRK